MVSFLSGICRPINTKFPASIVSTTKDQKAIFQSRKPLKLIKNPWDKYWIRAILQLSAAQLNSRYKI